MTAEAPRLGIYFNLPDVLYHEDPALGSSSMKTLAYEPHEWWWTSDHNEAKPEKNDYTPAKIFGSALHHRVLLGKEDYEKRYHQGGGANTTVPVAAYDKSLISIGRKDFDNWDKESKAMCLRRAGIELLTNTQWRNVELAAAMITKNPNLAAAFSNGVPEVAIFWEDNGIRKKAKIDYLKLKASVDAKSFAPRSQRNKEFDLHVFSAISNFQYYTQAAHYMEGRATMVDHIKAGRVYDGDHVNEEWLLEAAEAEHTPFIFVFYKSVGAPLSKGYVIRHASPSHRDGISECRMADHNYKTMLEKFGTDAWVMDDPLHEISEGEIWTP